MFCGIESVVFKIKILTKSRKVRKILIPKVRDDLL